MNLKLMPCFLLPLISIAASAGQPPTSKLEEALKLQADAWDVAIVNKDRRAIAANMADSFMLIDSDGGTADKEQFVQNIVAEDLSINPYTVNDFKIRIYENTALLTGTTDMYGTHKGRPFTSHYRYLDTYVNDNGTWKVVHVQTTPIK